ncbi:MAG: glutathione S-transferase [Myxococcota bacterium]
MTSTSGDNASLKLSVLSLRYSSWSIRPLLALYAAGAEFEVETVTLPEMGIPVEDEGAALSAHLKSQRARRQEMGSVIGLYPVLHVGEVPIHESLAICEWVAESYPAARLWPEDPLERARARSVSSEMATGFPHLRNHMSCQIFARVPNFQPDEQTAFEIERVFEIWQSYLDRSGGPFLFGEFGIPDCMYFPVLTRFRTYGVALPSALEDWARRLESHPAVRSWMQLAKQAPPIPLYDAQVREMGGDPLAVFPAD